MRPNPFSPIAIALLPLWVGCSSDGTDDDPGSPDVDTATDPIALYAPLLDDVPPEVCESNCEWPLRGTEWYLWQRSGSSDDVPGPFEDGVPVEPGAVYTLLFSEVDDRLVGRFACEELRATFAYEGGSAGEPTGPGGRLELDPLSVPDADCGLSGAAAAQDEALRAFIADDTLMVSTSGSILYLENAAGERWLYQARLDALDGVLRPFRVVAAGDRFGDAYDEVTGTSGFIVYDSAADFRETTPNLAASIGDALSGVDFERETLVGLFVEPLGYLGPTIRGEIAIERDDEVELQTAAGTFVCDDGFALNAPRGDNAPYSLVAIETTRRPVVQAGFASDVCP